MVCTPLSGSGRGVRFAHFRYVLVAKVDIAEVSEASVEGSTPSRGILSVWWNGRHIAFRVQRDFTHKGSSPFTDIYGGHGVVVARQIVALLARVQLSVFTLLPE